jgi:hypothetical protein
MQTNEKRLTCHDLSRNPSILSMTKDGSCCRFRGLPFSQFDMVTFRGVEMARARGASESKIVIVQCCGRVWSEGKVDGYGEIMRHSAGESNLRVISLLNKPTRIDR